MKNHHRREDHPKDAKKIRKGEWLVSWCLPGRPSWMDEETYARMPKEITVRLVDIQTQQPGFRSEGYTIATTIMDNEVHDVHWLGGAYRCRWFVELDIRTIKCTLHMEHLRSKTPEMVKTELWSCVRRQLVLRFSDN